MNKNLKNKKRDCSEKWQLHRIIYSLIAADLKAFNAG